MTAPYGEWLQRAERVLGGDASDGEIDELLAAGVALEPMSDGERATLDRVQVQRVIAVLSARRAAVAAELGDLARRRVALARAQAGASGYLNAADPVPMD